VHSAPHLGVGAGRRAAARALARGRLPAVRAAVGGALAARRARALAGRARPARNLRRRRLRQHAAQVSMTYGGQLAQAGRALFSSTPRAASRLLVHALQARGTGRAARGRSGPSLSTPRSPARSARSRAGRAERCGGALSVRERGRRTFRWPPTSISSTALPATSASTASASEAHCGAGGARRQRRCAAAWGSHRSSGGPGRGEPPARGAGRRRKRVD